MACAICIIPKYDREMILFELQNSTNIDFDQYFMHFFAKTSCAEFCSRKVRVTNLWSAVLRDGSYDFYNSEICWRDGIDCPPKYHKCTIRSSSRRNKCTRRSLIFVILVSWRFLSNLIQNRVYEQSDHSGDDSGVLRHQKVIRGYPGMISEGYNSNSKPILPLK